MNVDADRYFDAGPLVVRTEAVEDEVITYRPVQAAGTPIDDADVISARRDRFKERFNRI